MVPIRNSIISSTVDDSLDESAMKLRQLYFRQQQLRRDQEKTKEAIENEKKCFQNLTTKRQQNYENVFLVEQCRNIWPNTETFSKFMVASIKGINTLYTKWDSKNSTFYEYVEKTLGPFTDDIQFVLPPEVPPPMPDIEESEVEDVNLQVSVKKL